jgi:hypothetical protein
MAANMQQFRNWNFLNFIRRTPQEKKPTLKQQDKRDKLRTSQRQQLHAPHDFFRQALRRRTETSAHPPIVNKISDPGSGTTEIDPAPGKAP